MDVEEVGAMGRAWLRGRKALVTGGAKRIGRAIALALAREGVDVVVHSNTSGTEAAELAAELERLGVRAWTVTADFKRPDELGSLVSRALDVAGGLDVLVNSASIFPADRLGDLTLASLVENLEVNAWAPLVLCRDFARCLGEGRIVNLEDTRIAGFDRAHAGYILSKHALAAITRALAMELAPGITVNAVRPGLILPPPGEDWGYVERLTGTLPLRRHGEPDDVADAVVFLASSGFVTGEVVYVDGGRHLRELPAK
jgi:NAD(P)-dependent dehydrogenase (short-subunit alcohol dehydrogenase family)